MKRRTYLTSGSFIKDKWEWDYSSLIRLSSNEGNNYMGDDFITCWPPKNYVCSFCKREFKSAQALGGHMNVHRRDRARLRQLPPWIFECPYHPKTNSNPTPSFSSASSLSSPPPPSTPYSAKLRTPTLLKSSSLKDKKPVNELPLGRDLWTPKKGDSTKEEGEKDVLALGEFKSTTAYVKGCELEGSKRGGQVISLDLEMGFKDPKHVLDLELRLGYLN